MKAVFAETLTQHWNSQDSCIHSSVYNLFTRHLCLFFVFSNVACCRTGWKIAMSAPQILILLMHSKFFLSCFSSPWSCHPSLSSFSPPDSLAHVQRGQTTRPPPPSLQTQHPHKHTHWTHSSKLFCLNGVDFSPRCRDNRTSEGESPNRQKSPWGADLVAHFTLFVLSP